jgi:hypothetical protein
MLYFSMDLTGREGGNKEEHFSLLFERISGPSRSQG